MPESGGRTRKFFGMLALIVFVLFYVLIAMVIGAVWINPLGGLVQGLYYLTAGLVWIIPAYWIIRWSSPSQ